MTQLTPYQKEFVEATEKVVILSGGRASGKTFACDYIKSMHCEDDIIPDFRTEATEYKDRILVLDEIEGSAIWAICFHALMRGVKQVFITGRFGDITELPDMKVVRADTWENPYIDKDFKKSLIAAVGKDAVG